MKDINTKERFIAMFDILGFKDRVKENSHKQIYNELKEIKDDLKTAEKIDKIFITMDKEVAKQRGDSQPIKNSVIEHLLFSDTILFISDNVPDGLFSMIIKSKQLISHCLRNEIPIKGCLAVGEVSYNKKDQIIFGKPIIDAHLLAEEMKFMGVIIDHSLESDIERFKIIDVSNYILHGKVPLKSGSINHYYLEIKHNFKVENESERHDNDVYDGIKRMYQTVNAGPRAYYDNTLDLYFKDWDKKKEKKK